MEDIDVEELGELILQYTEEVNALFSLLSSIDVESSVSKSNTTKVYFQTLIYRIAMMMARRRKSMSAITLTPSPFLIPRIRIPKFDDDDDDFSEKDRIRIRNRKAVYKAVIKEENGKLSMSHVSLEPRGRTGVSLPVAKDDVIGFCWKEEMGVG